MNRVHIVAIPALLLTLTGCLRFPLLGNPDQKTTTLFTTAAQQNHQHPHAWYSLGRAQLEAGEYGDAIRSFDRALKLQSDLVEAWIAKGQALEAKGKLSKARNAYQQALHIRPQSVQPRHHLATLDLRDGNIDAAESLWREALRIQPDYPPALQGLGHLAYIQGDLTAALQYWRKARDLDPTRTELDPLIQDVAKFVEAYPHNSNDTNKSQ